MALAPAQGGLQRSAFTRHTVDEDPEVLPGSQLFLDQDRGVWHDLRLVHQSMFARGVEKGWRLWRADCELYWNMMKVDPSHFHLIHLNRVEQPEVLSNVADSYAVLAVFWKTAEACQTEGWRVACLNLFEKLQRRIEEAPASRQGEVHVMHEGILTTLLVNRNRLSEWRAWFLKRPQVTQRFFRSLWINIPECSQTPIEATTRRFWRLYTSLWAFKGSDDIATAKSLSSRGPLYLHCNRDC